MNTDKLIDLGAKVVGEMRADVEIKMHKALLERAIEVFGKHHVKDDVGLRNLLRVCAEVCSYEARDWMLDILAQAARDAAAKG